MEKTKIKEYKELFDNLKNGNQYYRLGKLFSTTEKKYFYDTGTGKIFEIADRVYEVLDAIFDEDTFDAVFSLKMDEKELESALDEIVESINKENILQAPPLVEFRGPHSEALEYYLEEQMSQLTLEVTEKCNLRCKYCIYQDSHSDFHGYANRDMQFETAKKAIDFAYPRTGKNFYVAFYGGEPLLNFKVIKESMEYVKQLVEDKNYGFSLTTNATLITEEIAKYFAENEVVILVSLDGPREIHDENRVYIDGTGSFEKTASGLKMLLEAYGDMAKTNIFISMVTSGPNIEEKYDKIQEFFKNTEWLPEDITVNPSYVSYGRQEEEYEMVNCKKEKMYAANRNNDPLISWSKENGINQTQLFSAGYIQRLLYIIHRRDLSNTPMNQYYFNGCCVPGSRRLHVNVEGKFLPCERVGAVPFIGNVNDGFDLEAIKKHYVQDFMEAAVPYCKNCWAVHILYNDEQIEIRFPMMKPKEVQLKTFYSDAVKCKLVCEKEPNTGINSLVSNTYLSAA